MKKALLLGLILLLSALTGFTGGQKERDVKAPVEAEAQEGKVYTLTASIVGPGPMGIKKATNLELAAENLNQQWKAAGSSEMVKLDVEFSELKWEPFAEKFYMDFKAGRSPDIFTLRETADLAKNKFIVPMDDHVKKFWEKNYSDFYPDLWKGATWAGKIWGIPHDISPTGVWYRKDVLRKLGYSDADIKKMMSAEGKPTMDLLAKLAKQAKDAGLVEFGILHRPSKGPGFYAVLLSFGADAYNPASDRLVLNKSAMLKLYQWHAQQVKDGVMPPETPQWKTIHSTFVEGKTFTTWASHVGTPSEWKEQYGLTDKTLEEDLGFIPFPPAVSGLSPVSVHDFPLYFISSQCKHPEVAAQLIMLATSPEAAAIHSQFTLRPPYRASALKHPLIKDMEYIQKVSSSAEVVTPVPIHPKFWTYMDRAFEALKGIQAGVVKPAEAVRDLESFVKAEIPDIEIIE